MGKTRCTIFLEYIPPYHGSDKPIFELTQHLDKSKFKVTYVVLPPLMALWELHHNLHNSRRIKYLFKFKNEKINNIKRILLPGWLLKCWKKRLYPSYIITFIYLFIKLIRLKKQFDSEINFINHPSPFTGLLGLLISKIFRKRIFMHCPDLISLYAIAVMVLGNHKSLIKEKGSFILEKLLLNQSDKILAVNSYIRDYIIRMKIKRKKIEIFPNGVDTSLFNPDIDNSKLIKKYNFDKFFNIIFVGIIEDWAGINTIIDSAKMLYNSHPNIRFLFIGDGKARNKFENMKNQANIKFLGYKPHKIIPQFIKSADIALLTFPNKQAYQAAHAASPLKIFEYMALGKPVISTYLAGLKDVIEPYKSGIFIYQRNPEELTKKILELYENENMRKKIGLTARKTIMQRYDWNVISRSFEQICFLSMLKEPK
ncbi:MAG: glycosyltransferase family 4 protein [Candidatus Hodarchaeota archaeon]